MKFWRYPIPFLNYLRSPLGIVVFLISAMMFAVVIFAPGKPAASEEYRVQNQYWQNGFLVQIENRDDQSKGHTLTMSEANLLQQQRIAYYARWSFVLISVSVVFAAVTIVTQQHQTHLALEAAQKADRPWVDFEFELVGQWRQVSTQSIPEVSSEFQISIVNHGKQPAFQLRFDINSVLKREGLSEVIERVDLRNASSEYGGPNIVMPESNSGTFGLARRAVMQNQGFPV